MERHSCGAAVNMRVLLVVAAFALATASVVKDDNNVVIGKDNMGKLDIDIINIYMHPIEFVKTVPL